MLTLLAVYLCGENGPGGKLPGPFLFQLGPVFSVAAAVAGPADSPARNYSKLAAAHTATVCDCVIRRNAGTILARPICKLRNRLKVIWVDARPIAAQVVYVVSVRNFSLMRQIRQPVCK